MVICYRKPFSKLANKFENVDEMDKFLERNKLPKLTQKEIDNLFILISIKKREL